ncbi:hypothetical protein BJ875DRAFT_455114 [Amylocarpus encephaloides]|uniref:Uncharacterized protein n=1 Tax=Amylocarpus encephaloides TaxID=45428 RepID=A0A9P8C7M6_9HELO|nr:hypothetical protein BJ875DRAFT_455114 [Amylocarpus encephaloides]
MLASRTATRAAARASLRRGRKANQSRFASTETKTAAAGGSSGLVGGLAGGALVFAAGYSYYHFSDAKTVVNAASATKAQFSKLTENLELSAPEPNETLKWLKSTTTSYAAFIPGGKGYVDTLFKDLERVQQKHRTEVEKIVNDAYNELKEASKNGLNMDSVAKAWSVIEKAAKQLGDLAGDSAEQIMDNHPGLKEKFGGQIDQLKIMGENFGPDAKKEVEDMWGTVSDAVKGGLSAGSLNEVRKILQEKVEKLKAMGNEGWKRGLEQMKPYLDKSPKVKEVIEENAESLKQGNAKEIVEKVKYAVDSGNVDDLKQYVKDAGEKVKKGGFDDGIEKYDKMIPGGSEIFAKLQKLQGVANKRGDEAEKIVEGAYKDIQDVLQKRTEEAEKLAEKAKDDSKK